MASKFIIDDRSSGELRANNGQSWRAVSDRVMGGVSNAKLEACVMAEKPCLHLSGEVSLENNGGFVQASLDFATVWLDASDFKGIEIEVCGSGGNYNVHLRTADTQRVWQSYRHTFTADENWKVLHLPFANFIPHRIELELNTGQLRRMGIVAIGRKMRADICFRSVALYR